MATFAIVEKQRTDPRLEASLPIMLEWQTRLGVTCRARGTTHNISLGGVYCYLEQPLATGVWVRFHIVLPGELTAGDPVNLRCTGRVLRCETLGRRFGIAISIEGRQAIANQLPANGPNRRACARVMPLATIPVVYPELRAVIRDVSLTGAFIEDPRMLPVGRLMELRLGGGDGLGSGILVKAVVRRVEPHVGMAVEFVYVGKEANRQLQELIDTCAQRCAGTRR